MSSATILNSQATLDMNLTGVKLVEASAGTGKTYAIGNLYLRMLLDGCAVSEILVVTFTKAATEELRGRIRQRIYDALEALEDMEKTRSAHRDEFLQLWVATLSDEAADLAARQLKLALSSMDEAAIYTIHGFCQRSLTEHAFNSRQAFDVEMITDDRQIWEDAIKDWWRINTYGLSETDLLALTGAIGSLGALIQLQLPLRKPGVKLVPELKLSLDQVMQQRQQLEAEFGELALSWQKEREKLVVILRSGGLKQNKHVYKPGGLTALFAEMDAYADAAGQPMAYPAQLSELGITSLSKALNKKGQGDPAFEHPFFVEVDRLLAELEAISGNIRISTLNDVSRFATEHVASVKQQSGQMAFDDQLVLLERALASSPELAQAIRKHFPVAMIDEFQDTDAVQYAIFRHIYPLDNTDDCSLIMIGDPKQAIYSFRGGDIFAYIKAKQDATEHYTLDTNWRSTKGLIQAVNQLFAQQHEPFIYPEIPFEPVKSSAKDVRVLCRKGNAVTPLTLWQIPADAAGKPMNKTAITPWMHAHVANEIVCLLSQGRDGLLTLGEKPVQAKDIAVLVRGHAEAAGLRDALKERGVAAVASGRRHVFESDEATGLQRLLAAVVGCKDADLLRQALASSLLGLDYSGIYQSIRNDQRWLDWTVHFSELHQTWVRRGFMAMFQQMLKQLHIGESLAQGRTAERRLTDLLHLGELLQQATQSITGMDALLVWFEHQLSDASSGEDTELRLENDADLVSIVTIHSSKGLEYPIVFLPYMWSCRPNRHTANLLAFYDQDEGCRCLDAALNDEHLLLAEKERLAEDVRLSYVALTRACSKIYLAWGDVTFRVGSNYDSSATALGWLLHKGQQVGDLGQHLPRAFQSGSAAVAQDLKSICDASGQTIELQTLDAEMPDSLCFAADDAQDSMVKAEIFSGDISEEWRISSFSSLTRDVHQHVSRLQQTQTHDTDNSHDSDSSDSDSSDSDSSDSNNRAAIFNYPAGSQTGLFLHALFETLDFQSRDINAVVQDFTIRHAVRYGLDPEQHPTVQLWVNEVLQTSIHADGMKLADIASAQRLNELPFDFSVQHLDVNLLNQKLDQIAGTALQPIQSYQHFSGYMTGVIDLIFEHDGRYYLADYKSNHLGYRLDAYAPEQLQQAIYDRRYDLQYLIYTLALHRYLKLRLPDYDYQQHFGGAYYLFLRGMRSASGCRYGVHYDKPDQALIEYLDIQVFRARAGS